MLPLVTATLDLGLLAGMHRVRVTAQGQVQTSWKSVLMCRSPSCTCAEMRSIDSRTLLPGRLLKIDYPF